MKRKRTPITKMFLYRQGLHLLPSDNFLQAFKKNYMEIIRKRKAFKDMEDIDDDTAMFFIMYVAESIIYCLDAGFDIWFHRAMVFTQRLSDYRYNAKVQLKKLSSKTIENVKKVTIKPISSLTLKIRDSINKNNKPYQDFIKEKEQNFKKIKEYYKEFYGKQKDWWKKDN